MIPGLPGAFVLVGALALGVLLAAWAMVLRRQARLSARLQDLEEAVGGLRRDVDAVGAGSLAALERLDRIEPVLEQFGERLEPLEAGSAGKRYELAAAAASRGAGRDELVSRFDLAPGEAELVMAMQRRRPAST